MRTWAHTAPFAAFRKFVERHTGRPIDVLARSGGSDGKNADVDRNLLVYASADTLTQPTPGTTDARGRPRWTHILQEFFVPEPEFVAWLRRAADYLGAFQVGTEGPSENSATEATDVTAAAATAAAEDEADDDVESWSPSSSLSSSPPSLSPSPPHDSDEKSRRRGRVVLLNLTVRRVAQDPDDLVLLNYARHPVAYAAVLYWRVARAEPDAERRLSEANQALTKMTLECNGTFYLPYRRHYTKRQLRAAYPRFDEFAARKHEYDPAGVFDSEWWSAYSDASAATLSATVAVGAPAETRVVVADLGAEIADAASETAPSDVGGSVGGGGGGGGGGELAVPDIAAYLNLEAWPQTAIVRSHSSDLAWIGSVGESGDDRRRRSDILLSISPTEKGADHDERRRRRQNEVRRVLVSLVSEPLGRRDLHLFFRHVFPALPAVDVDGEFCATVDRLWNEAFGREAIDRVWNGEAYAVADATFYTALGAHYRARMTKDGSYAVLASQIKALVAPTQELLGPRYMTARDHHVYRADEAWTMLSIGDGGVYAADRYDGTRLESLIIMHDRVSEITRAKRAGDAASGAGFGSDLFAASKRARARFGDGGTSRADASSRGKGADGAGGDGLREAALSHIPVDYASVESIVFAFGRVKTRSVNVTTLYVGLHHYPPAHLAVLLANLARVTVDGGAFVLREHNARPKSLAIVTAAHMLFNSISGVAYADEAHEHRNFQPLTYWRELLLAHEFVDTYRSARQPHDPTHNVLMLFEKRPRSPASVTAAATAL